MLRNLNFLVAFMLVIWWEAKLAKIDYTRAVKYFFLADVWQGMKLGLKYFFAPKTTINYPYEKGPLSPSLEGSTLCADTQTEKKGV